LENIVLVTHSSEATGGGEDDFLRLVKYLSKRYNLYLIIPNGPRAQLLSEYAVDYLITRFNIFPLSKSSVKSYIKYILVSFLRSYDILKFLIKKKKIVISYINSSVCFSDVLILRFFRIPVIICIKENIQPVWIRKLIFKWINYFSCAIIVISKFLKNVYFEDTGNNNAYIVYPLIEEELYRKIYDNLKTFRKTKDGKLVLLNIGVICNYKAQHLLIEAIKMTNLVDKVKLKFIGRVTSHKYFDYLNSIKHNCEIEFLGELKKEDTIKEIYDANCVIITSLNEGFSITVIESLFFNKPVITSNVGIVPEIIKHKENGLIYKTGDSGDLADKINLLFNDNSLFKKISESSNKSILSKFNLDLSLKKYDEVIKLYKK